MKTSWFYSILLALIVAGYGWMRAAGADTSVAVGKDPFAQVALATPTLLAGGETPLAAEQTPTAQTPTSSPTPDYFAVTLQAGELLRIQATNTQGAMMMAISRDNLEAARLAGTGVANESTQIAGTQTAAPTVIPMTATAAMMQATQKAEIMRATEYAPLVQQAQADADAAPLWWWAKAICLVLVGLGGLLFLNQAGRAVLVWASNALNAPVNAWVQAPAAAAVQFQRNVANGADLLEIPAEIASHEQVRMVAAWVQSGNLSLPVRQMVRQEQDGRQPFSRSEFERFKDYLVNVLHLAYGGGQGERVILNDDGLAAFGAVELGDA
jgi:hypothetical protein